LPWLENGLSPFGVGDQLRQTLERRGGFEHEFFHGQAPRLEDRAEYSTEAV
jgi:hypothetical protein